ncbi:MAG: hypothetical protein HYW26_02530 [Candidatus Aenigmarchaeota archaeon]|nr:hypothetical protein [Candidatus Aenigmarchaeota archaeon]
MKGVVNIEFIISVLVFLGTVFFLIISVANNVPQFHEGSLVSSLRSRSFSMSEALLLDEGAPKNWNSGNVKRIGLSTPEKYVISMQKINALKGMCSDNYNNVRDLVTGDPNFAVVINITNVETNEVYVYCAPPVATLVLPQSLVKRYGVLESKERVSIEVGVA